MQSKWYQKVYRRNVVDMHIPDWNDAFLSEFDSEAYVRMLTLSQAKSAVVYAHSHVGLCNYPSKIGPMHKGLKGRNILGEVIDLCHQNDIQVVVYYSLIFDTWAYRNHPEWRIITASGEGAADRARKGVCCPNSPYRNYAVAMVEEICENFEFEGIRLDMTFWPCVCYCPHCQSRFDEEVGGELPQIVNWEDPHWTSFQRKREDWLVEFAALLTSAVRRVKPDVTVEHQSSTYVQSWLLGVTERMARQNDFLQGDFYGDSLQGSFVRKLFHNLSEGLPYGFETTSCVDLTNHTAMKSAALLKNKVCASMADGGAFVFIDAIDPVGTLNDAVYERMGGIFEETQVYEPYLGGDLCQDVGVYLSTESKFDPADDGKAADAPDLSTRMPHVDGALNACQSLIHAHMPFGVITKKNLADLSRHRVVVLPNVLMMDEEEVEAFREYVRAGGCLYASKYTSLTTKDGRRRSDFLLADIFGVSYLGETQEDFTYVAPADGAEELFFGYSQKYPLALPDTQMQVVAHPGTRVLGQLVLPYTDPADPIRFASIHSNPPGVPTNHPAIVLNRFGAGQAMYVAGALENTDLHRDIFVNLIRLLAGPLSVEADAPKPVEITVSRQEDKQRLIVNLVNFQKELPNIPIDGIKVRVCVGDRDVKRLILLPAGTELEHELKDGFVDFVVPRLETFAMVALEYL